MTISRSAPHGAVAALGLLAAMLAPAAHAAFASSDFEAGIDGWLGYSCPNPGNCVGIPAGGNAGIAHVLGGGAPPGANYIEMLDPGDVLAARAEPNPAKFAGHYLPGRTIAFDVLVLTNGGGGEYNFGSFGPLAPLLAFESPVGLLVYTTSDLPVIDGPWKHYDVPLVASNDWLLLVGPDPGPPSPAQFDAALASMTRLTVIAEWLDDVPELDTGGIDNFQVVPVPAALPLLGGALGLLGFATRRRAR